MAAAELVLPGGPVHGICLIKEVAAVDPLAVGPLTRGTLAHEDRPRQAIGDLADSKPAIVHEHPLLGIVGGGDPLPGHPAVVGAAQAGHEGRRTIGRRTAIHRGRCGPGGGVGGMIKRLGKVQQVGQRLLFQPGQNPTAPGKAAFRPGRAGRPPLRAAHGKRPPGEQMAVQPAADVPEIVEAGDTAGRLAGRLRGGQEQADETGDHEHHDEQLHQRHAGSMSACGWMSGGHARTCGLGAHRPRKGPAAARHHESSLSGKRNERPPHA